MAPRSPIRTRSIPRRLLAPLGLALLVAGAPWPAEAASQAEAVQTAVAPGATPAAEVERPPRPFTLSVAVNAVFPSIGGGLSCQPFDRLALGVQVTTLIVHVDASLRARLYLLPGRRGGPYLGGNLHLWYSPLVLGAATHAATGEVGWEWRTEGGLAVGLGLGAGRIRIPGGSQGTGPDAHWDTMPLANLRVGRTFGLP